MKLTEKTTRYLIETRGLLLGTIKFQPILADGCTSTISKINSELETRGIYSLKTKKK
jgi:hypothetical protein